PPPKLAERSVPPPARRSSEPKLEPTQRCAEGRQPPLRLWRWHSRGAEKIWPFFPRHWRRAFVRRLQLPRARRLLASETVSRNSAAAAQCDLCHSGTARLRP